ncbi:hypothetical protein [Oceanobacillus sp. CFH 90083]|nr:hypothetical protein [Oceanobacillus sp. CFH 90083]
MKGSCAVIIIILLILLTGFFTWLWMQGFKSNQESITALINSWVYPA